MGEADVNRKAKCDEYDGKERGKEGQQRSIQDWKVIFQCLEVSRSQRKHGGWTSSGGEMG